MTAQADPYVRVYYRITDDPKFATVYDDDAALALWLRLLLIADAMHPAPASIPRGTKAAALAKLVRAGLIEAHGNRYRVHGLAAEREQRSEQSRKAADARWQQSDRNAPALREHSGSNAAPMPYPNRTEPIQSEPRRTAPAGSTGLKAIRDVLEGR